MLSQEAIDEFKQIYQEVYGVDLDNKSALEKAIKLLTLFKAIYRPIPIGE